MTRQRKNVYTDRPGRHIDIPGFSKILVKEEQKQIADWLCGRAPHAITGHLLDTNSTEGRQAYIIYNMLLGTGLRETELASLRIKDCPAVIRADVIWVYMGKGKKDRTVPLCDTLKKALNEYIDQVRPKLLPRWVSNKDINRPVFYNMHGRPYLQIITKLDKNKKEIQSARASTALYRIIKSIGVAAGLTKRLHPHMLRHTCIVEALKKGMAVIDVMGMVGHFRIETTQKYVHLLHLSNDYLVGLKGKLEHVAV